MSKRASLFQDISTVVVALLVVLLVCFMFPDFFTTVELPEVDSGFHKSSAQENLLNLYLTSEQQEATGESNHAGSLDLDNAELIELFMDPQGLNCDAEKAYGLLACYNAATELGLSSWESIGLLSCAINEGEPGLVQYGYPQNPVHPVWKSWYDNPLYIDDGLKREALIQLQPGEPYMGIGTAQWTGSRCMTWLELSKELYPGDQKLLYEELYSIDLEMYRRELQGSYSSIVTDMKDHNDTLEHVVGFSLFIYEAGSGNINNSATDPFSIDAYNGTVFHGIFSLRYESAKRIEAAFKAAGVIT